MVRALFWAVAQALEPSGRADCELPNEVSGAWWSSWSGDLYLGEVGSSEGWMVAGQGCAAERWTGGLVAFAVDGRRAILRSDRIRVERWSGGEWRSDSEVRSPELSEDGWRTLEHALSGANLVVQQTGRLVPRRLLFYRQEQGEAGWRLEDMVSYDGEGNDTIRDAELGLRGDRLVYWSSHSDGRIYGLERGTGGRWQPTVEVDPHAWDRPESRTDWPQLDPENIVVRHQLPGVGWGLERYRAAPGQELGPRGESLYVKGLAVRQRLMVVGTWFEWSEATWPASRVAWWGDRVAYVGSNSAGREALNVVEYDPPLHVRWLRQWQGSVDALRWEGDRLWMQTSGPGLVYGRERALWALDFAPRDADGDGWPSSKDCDDLDVAIHPGRPERRNLVDDDCDGYVDEGLAATPASAGLDPSSSGEAPRSGGRRSPGCQSGLAAISWPATMLLALVARRWPQPGVRRRRAS